MLYYPHENRNIEWTPISDGKHNTQTTTNKTCFFKKHYQLKPLTCSAYTKHFIYVHMQDGKYVCMSTLHVFFLSRFQDVFWESVRNIQQDKKGQIRSEA